MPNQLHVGANSNFQVYLQNGQVFIYTLGTWVAATNEPANLIQAIIGPFNSVWGVDQGGRVYRYNGTTWDQDPNARNVVSLSCDHPNDYLWCATNTGEVFVHYPSTPFGTWMKVWGDIPALAGTPGMVWEYTVKAGDWLYKIVRAEYGTGADNVKTGQIVAEIIRLNPAIGPAGNIKPGDKLKMPPK
jgi:nucleoid-associated protein YgaU